MSFNRFSSLKSDDSSKNRFKSNQKYQKYQNTRDSSNNYVPPNLKINDRWKKENFSSNESRNTFKKKRFQNNRHFQQNRRGQQNHQLDNNKFQKLGQFNLDIALKKSQLKNQENKKERKEKKKEKKKEKLQYLSKDHKNCIDFNNEEDSDDLAITLALAEQYQYYTESEEDDEEETLINDYGTTDNSAW